jgi:hypothetical protein
MVTTRSCQGLADYWTSLCPPDRLPLRSDIDPAAIQPLLPYIYILELKTDDTVFVRLAGTALRRLYGREMTGMNMLDLVPPAHRAARLRRTLQAASHPCGMCYIRSHRYASGAVDEVESMFLPLTVDPATDGTRARQMIGIAASLSERRWIAEDETGTLMMPRAFRFLDVGFGVPPMSAPPDRAGGS